MDSLIAASARALAAGDALGALKRVALREDAPALALRGIAMAQLGELDRARELLRRAQRAFGPHEVLSRARCVVAEAEVALALRDLGGSQRPLLAALATMQARADRANLQQARLIAVRRLLLLGRLDEAAAALAQIESPGLLPALAAVAELSRAELAMRLLEVEAAHTALIRAHVAADRSGVPALQAEVAQAKGQLERPAARRVAGGVDRAIRLEEVAALLASGELVVDACRRGAWLGAHWRSLASRPVLFSLLCALGAAWPGDVDRQTLIGRAFRTRHPDDTHRVRLRVEIGRLRALLKPLASIQATARGFALRPVGDHDVVMLVPPVDGDPGSLLALLADGAAWSSSALSLALGASQRTVQRALAELQAEGRVRSIGRARSRRWLAPPMTGFTTILLLPGALPLD